MRYLVMADCYGFMGKYWSKGEEVSLDESLTPPSHFKRLEETHPELADHGAAESHDVAHPAPHEPAHSKRGRKPKSQV